MADDLRDRSQSHRALVRAVEAAAPARGWRLFPVGQTSGRPRRREHVPGLPDLVGLTDTGRFVGVEVKTGRGRLSPAQQAIREVIEQRGGVWIELRDVRELFTGARAS